MSVHTYQRKNAGLTLVETIVTIAIFTLIMGAVVSSLIYFYRSNAYSVEQSSAITFARRGVEILTEDIREATYSEGGAFPVKTIGSYSITVFSDVDQDNDVERVRYFLDDTNLMRGVTSPTSTPVEYRNSDEDLTVLASHVRNQVKGTPIFTYYNKSGGSLTDFSNVGDLGFVEVNLTININPQRLPQDYTLHSSATLRNLKGE